MGSSSTAAVAKRLEPPAIPASSRMFTSSERRILVFCLLLTVVVLLAYNPITHNGFLNYDDDAYITSNPHVRAGLTWATVKWAFTTYDTANWHPVTWLSHALDCQLFGLNPVGHHYVNLLLHAINVVLLFLLLRSATGCHWRSLLVAALFALHPINVESVAWAAERKNVLSMMFFLLALYAYGAYARQPGLRRYSVVVFLFALALLSKPQVITFPLLLVLWDYWPLLRIGTPSSTSPQLDGATRPRLSSTWLVLEKLPLLVLSAASAIVTMKAQSAGLAVRALSQYSVPLRLETVVISYVRYLGKALWPVKLVALYPHPEKLYPGWQVASALVLLLVVTFLVFRARDQRYLPVGWFWFLGSLVPMIGLVQVGLQAMADRYAYLPFIGLFLMLTWLAADLAKGRQLAFRWLALAAVSCLLLLGTATYRQIGHWRDSESLWRRTLALAPDNYIAQVNLGDVLFSQGRSEEAAMYFRAALATHPDSGIANLNLGAYEDARGNLPAAIERYQQVALHGTDAGIRTAAYNSLGFIYRGMAQPVHAKQCFETALQLKPDSARAMTGLALIAQSDRDMAAAVRLFSRAIEIQPTDAGSLLLAQALRQQGRIDDANAISERVARFSANPAEAQKTAQALLSGK